MSKPKLNSEQQTFIVQQLAMFGKPVELQRALRQIYDVEIELSSIVHYDIDNSKFPAKWREIFEATRKEFLEKIVNVPTSHKAVRVKKLDQYVEEFEKNKNLVGAAQMLEQIAKEMGDAFTNRRELSGVGGEPIQHSVVRVPPKSSMEEWNKQSQAQMQTARASSESEN
jgi:hypothetical protein